MYKQTRGINVSGNAGRVQLIEMWRDRSYPLHGTWVAKQTVQVGYEHGDLADELPNKVFFVVRAMDDEQGTVYVNLTAVCPSVVEAGEMRAAADSMGMDINEDAEIDTPEVALMLAEYGIGAPIGTWEIDSPDGRIGWEARPVLRKDCEAVMREVRQVIAAQRIFIGFELDQPVNLLGTTGWDAMRGDMIAGVYYYPVGE